MRREFHPLLFDYMRQDERIWVLVGDLGYGMFNCIRDEFPKRFINVGAAEQLLITCSVGLAIEGKIPVAYSITPFLLFRPAEAIRLYLYHENIPVKLLSAGRNKDYSEDGFSHDATGDREFMKLFPNIECFWPETVDEMKNDLKTFLSNGKPSYLNLKR